MSNHYHLLVETPIWATWGDPARTNQQDACTNGATWTNGYLGVWHINTIALEDSISNKLNGAITGVGKTVGVSGAGQYFDSVMPYQATAEVNRPAEQQIELGRLLDQLERDGLG